MNLEHNSNRAVFLDNLRALMVILVLIFHSGASYGTGAEFWPFHDSNSSGIIDIFMFICDVFMMALLFFIAGYFAWPSLRKNGTRRFINSKLKRLGLPWIIISVFVLPVLDYVHYLIRNREQALPTLGLPEYWALSMKKIAGFYTGWMDMSAYWSMTEAFYQRYMWFLSLLLVFFIVFALLHKLKPYVYKKTDRQNVTLANSKKDVFRGFLIVSVIMVILFGVARFNYPEFMGSGWFSLGNLIQFQFGKLILYACCFTLGILAFSGKWFSGFGFGKAIVWALVCFCLFGLNMLVLKNLTSTATPALGFKLAFCALYPLWTLSFIGFFVSLAHKYWNRSTKLNKSVSNNSYNMYLVHYIVPFTLPLMLSDLAVPTLLKFFFVSVVTLVFSYAFSRFVMTPMSKAIRK